MLPVVENRRWESIRRTRAGRTWKLWRRYEDGLSATSAVIISHSTGTPRVA